MRQSILDNPQDIASRRREIAIEEGKGCQRCGSTVSVERKHQNTAYDYPSISRDPNARKGDKNDPNYVTLCQPCHEENDKYWRGMWDEYWSSRL